MIGCVLIVFGMMFGLFKLVFFLLGIGVIVVGYFLGREKKDILEDLEFEKFDMVNLDKNEVEDVINLINVELIEVEIGYGLIFLVDELVGGDLF